MSNNFKGITFPWQEVTPSDDAVVRRAILPDRILTGCDLSYQGSILTMNAGYMLVCGRQFKHTATKDWIVSNATSGYARLLLTIDVSKTSTKDAFEQISMSIEYATSINGFPDLRKDDINGLGVLYQTEICVVSLGPEGITGILSSLTKGSLTFADVLAAPAGYGLGISDCINIDSFKNITKNGWWISSTDTPDGSWWRCLATVTNVGNNIVLDAWSLDGKFRASLTKNDTWDEWEWVNPPMNKNVEYRTTERHGGKPVYRKLVKFGTAPNNTSKTENHNISNIARVIEWHCYNYNSGTNVEQSSNMKSITITKTSITVTTSANEADMLLYFIIKYIKT